jgi:dipeptidyl aminopeptidase/acylaminoacyl peptidase
MSSSDLLTAEELSDRKYPSSPAISNDGRFVAFVVQPVGKPEERDISSIWLSRNGASAQQFTTGLAGDKSPVFSPDSKKLAFVSDRHEHKKYRLYVLPLDGGEAMRLGTVEGELSEPKWSPDGAKVAVLVTDPETEDEKKRKEERNDPIVEEQHQKFTRLFVVDVETGRTLQLTHGNRSVLAYGWSRDGQQLAIVTSPRTDVEAEFRDVELAIVPATGGRWRRLATLRGLASGLTFVEKDGKPIIAARFNGFFDDPVDSIWLFSVETGEGHELLEDDHGNVESIYPIANRPGELGLAMVDEVHCNAWIVDVTTGKRCLVLDESWRDKGSVVNGMSVSADGSKIAFIWSDSTTPEEVYLAKSGGTPTRLTELGKAFEGRLNPVEVVEWQSDDWTIQGLLTYPQGYEEGKRYPLLIEAHGGPTWQWEDRAMLDWHDWAQYMASRGFAVLAPNPRGSAGRGTAFQRALQNDVGGGEVRDLINGAKAMVERGIADPDRLGIGGWSWGGYLTATTITKTDIFKAAMMGAGLSNLISDHGTDDIPSANLLYFPGDPYHHLDMYWEGSAIKNVANCKTPTLIIHGDADERVTPSQGKEMYTALTRLGVEAEFVRYPRMGHNISERNYQIDLLNRLGAWFEKHLKG